jgi:hypothetical protein
MLIRDSIHVNQPFIGESRNAAVHGVFARIRSFVPNSVGKNFPDLSFSKRGINSLSVA